MYEWTHDVMRRCVVSRGSSISRCFSAGCRSSTSEPYAAQDAAPKGEPAQAESEPLVEHIAARDTDSSLRASSEYSNEAGSTKQSICSARRPLPLSPLMDPVYLAAKEKHRLPKAAPSKEPTPFQRRLAKNPYAQALASPVRMCVLTRTWLPSFFLQDFELIAHPSTNEPWYLPRSLTSPYSSQPLTSGPSGDSYSTPNGAKRGPKAYVLSRAALLRATNVPKSGFTNGYERFASARSMQWNAFRRMRIRWRSDIDEFVLELMRRRVVESLKYLYGRKMGYLLRCRSWEDVRWKKEMGAILWLGIKGGEKVLVDGDNEEKGQEVAGGSPGEFATLDVNKEMKSKVPVHNLRLLLGEAHVEDLRRHSPQMFDRELVVLRNRKATIDLQLRLWKLQGYLAKHEQVDSLHIND